MRRNYLLAILIILVGVSFSVSAFIALRNWDHKKARISFENMADYRYQTFAKEIELNLSAVESLKALYTGVPEVTRSQFGEFTRYVLSMHSSIQGAGWVPRIPDEQRALCEERAKREGFPTFHVTERDALGRAVRAAKRGEYFPVYFIEPYQGNEAALGFDLASNEARRTALNIARDTGQITASQRVKLIVENNGQYGILLVVPVYRRGAPTVTLDERRENLQGFVLGVFRIGDIVERSLANTSPKGIPFTVYDITARAEQEFLYHHASRRPSRGMAPDNGSQPASGPGFQYEKRLNVAGREWQMVFTVDPDYAALSRSWQPWAAFLIGLLLTGLAVTYLCTIARHIRSLSAINSRLIDEVDVRKRAEGALKKSEATLRSAFSASPIGFALLGLDRNIEWMSDGMIALTGYTMDEARTRSLRELYQTEDEFLRVGKIVYGVVRSGAVGEVDTTWMRKDAAVLDIRLRAAAIDPNDPSTRVVFTATDVTIQKQAEMVLRESEARYRALFDDSPVALVELDGSGARAEIAAVRASGVTDIPGYLDDRPDKAREFMSLVKLLHVNKAALELFEASDEENYRRAFEKLIARMPNGLLRDDVLIISEMDGDLDREHVSVTTTGREIYLASRWTVAPGYEESHRKILVSFTDITRRKEIEDALRTSHLQLSDAADLAHIAYWEADPQAGEFIFNDSFYALFGTTAEQEGGYRMALKEYPTRFVHPDDLERYYRHVEKTDADLPDLVQLGHRVIRGDGEVRHVLNRARFVKDAAGRITKIYGTNQDITERKKAEEMLQQLLSELESKNRELEAAYADLKTSHKQILQQEKMASIGVLAAGMAHEINNPMGFIISNLNSLQKYTERLHQYVSIQSEAIEALSQHGNGAAESMLARTAESRRSLKIDYILDDSESLVKESLEGADRVKRIVQDLKSFSRVDGTEIAPTDVNKVLESTINIVWNELKHKATLKKEYGDLPPILGNHGQLSQVFMNILVNAVQAIPDHGEIAVRTWADGSGIHVGISDTGCGIPEDQMSRLFEPFYTTKEIGQGTGLGLSIAYDIVKKHHGEIEARSTVGQGTTFTVTLPLEVI